MLGMKTHFDISDSIEIRKVDIAGVACILNKRNIYCPFTDAILHQNGCYFIIAIVSL